jgi:hypothetical protein
MSDIEHQLIMDLRALLERTRYLAEVARRSLVAARDAQDAAGGHEPWLDDAFG